MIRGKIVAIMGLGLIGGSIALALKESLKDDITVTAFDCQMTTIEYARQCTPIDFVTDDYIAAVEKADLVILAVPVLQMIPLAQTIMPHLKEGAVLTDVGSTKSAICREMAPILREDISFVAGHPMAGIELSGIAAAKVDLFNNKFYIISPETAKNDASVQLVEAMVRAIGAIPTTLDLTHHDSCVAVISHVPHVAAAGLVNLLGCSPEDLEHNLKLAGGGFRDTTRIASSDADMWADICISNGKAIQKTLRSYQEMMGLIIDAIEDGDRQAIHSFFRTAKLRRDALLNETEAKTRREQ